MPRLRVTPHLKLVPWTKTPNVLLDIWMPDLKDTELRVLLVLIRQTAGWNREGRTVTLSYDDLKRKTGRQSEAIALALRSLSARGLVHITGRRLDRSPKTVRRKSEAQQ